MKKKKKRKIWIRLVAILLILTMAVGYWASALIDIKIADDASNAAMSYLATNTEYVKANKTARFLNLVQSMKPTESLDDYYLQASMRIGSARYEDALPYIDKCLELCSPVKNKAVYVDVLTKKGCLLALLERDDEAIDALNLVLETEPAATDVYLVLAQIYLEKNDVEKIEETLNSYLEYDPDDIDIRVTYMQTLIAQGKEDEAAEQGKLVVTDSNATETNLDDAYHILGLIDFGNKNFSDALKSFDKIKDTAGNYPDLFYDKGICYMSDGEMDKATEFFTKSIEAGYNKQESMYSRGVCEFSKDEPDYQSAVNDLVAAYEYSEEDRDEETAAMAEEFLKAIAATE